jgi:hypothetical protein
MEEHDPSIDLKGLKKITKNLRLAAPETRIDRRISCV